MGEHDAEAWVSAGDWEVLYRRYFSRIQRYCARSLGDSNEAQDLAQQVFIELARTKIPEEPLPYLQAIARNVVGRHRRRKMAEQSALAEYLLRQRLAAQGLKEQEATRDPPQGDSREIVKDVLTALAHQLPPQDAEIVTLRFVEGLSVKEVARRLHCSENAVSKRLQKLKVILRALCRE